MDLIWVVIPVMLLEKATDLCIIVIIPLLLEHVIHKSA